MGERAVRKRPIVAFLIQLLLAIRLRFTRRTRLEALFAFTLCASRLGHQPIAKRLHAGPLQGTLGIDQVIGEAGRQAEFERPSVWLNGFFY